MTQHTFRFIANQADPGVIFTPAKDATNPMAPGNLAGWSSPSFELHDDTRLESLVADGGHWVGTVHMLPGDVVNMTATYFPREGEADNIQLAGPIVLRNEESRIAVVGGGGKYAGARGEARLVVAMSDQSTPLYRYVVTVEV